jgi:hypothetical protein
VETGKITERHIPPIDIAGRNVVQDVWRYGEKEVSIAQLRNKIFEGDSARITTYSRETSQIERTQSFMYFTSFHKIAVLLYFTRNLIAIEIDKTVIME